MTRQEIEQMSGLITNLIIDKFLDIDIKDCNCDFSSSNNTISFDVKLKEKHEREKDEYYSSTLQLTIEKGDYKIITKIREFEHPLTNYGTIRKQDVYSEKIQLPKLWTIFLSKKNKQIKKKIKEFFEFQENKREYNKLKEVIDNHLDNKSLRKLKLENLKNNS